MKEFETYKDEEDKLKQQAQAKKGGVVMLYALISVIIFLFLLIAGIFDGLVWILDKTIKPIKTFRDYLKEKMKGD